MTLRSFAGSVRRGARRHPKVAKVLLLLASTLVSLAGAEVVLRLLQRTDPGHHQLFCEYHPVLGWQKKPNFSGVHVGPEKIYRIPETMNSKGLRGPEYPYQKPPDEYRVVVLGDSFVEGYTVEFEEVFSEVLKRRLTEAQWRPVEVINSGTGGYSTDQELLWFTTEGVKYSPDLAILLFTSNDVLFNTVARYWRGHKPLFQLVDGELKLTNVPVPPPVPPPEGPVSLRLRVTAWLYDSSYLYRNVRRVLTDNEKIRKLFVWVGLARPRPATVEVEDREAGEGDSAGEASGSGRDSAPDYVRFSDWSRATEQEREHAWRVTEALLSKLKTEALAAGSGLLIMILPGNDEVTHGVASICRRSSIDCIDPTPRFRAEELRLKQRGKRLDFAPHDYHWNAEGHRLAGEVLFDHILNEGYLPPVGE